MDTDRLEAGSASVLEDGAGRWDRAPDEAWDGDVLTKRANSLQAECVGRRKINGELHAVFSLKSPKSGRIMYLAQPVGYKYSSGGWRPNGGSGNMKPGYAYQFTGRNWRTSSDERWDTVVLDASDLVGAKIVGKRRIDGTMCVVVRLADGTWVAQTEAYARNPRPNHGKDPHRLSYGQVPDLRFFREHLADYYDWTSGERRSITDDEQPVFYGDLRGDDARVMRKVRLVGLDFNGERFEVDTVYSLHRLIKALVKRWENGDEPAGDLASSFMSVLGFEWV